MHGIELLATLWPSFPHFPRFAHDPRLAGIRLNSAMMNSTDIEKELLTLDRNTTSVPLYFDVKGRQLRIAEVNENRSFLDIRLNHPISVETPTPVLFKAGADSALLGRVEEGGYRLIFDEPPQYKVRDGESLHIRHPSLRVMGPLFTDAEFKKIQLVREAGFRRYFLSYVEQQRDVDEFLGLVGRDSEVWLKIENPKGLEYVANSFKKRDNLILVAARGDLYVELERPHEIMQALKLIASKDPKACVGSRILLSIVETPVPSCADFLELSWLYDIGYRSMLLCDELCLKEQWLAPAINAFDRFAETYARPSPPRSFLRKIFRAA